MPATPRFSAPGSRRSLAALAALLIVAVIAVVVIVVSSGGGTPAPKVATLPPPVTRKGPESIFTAGAALKGDPAGTVARLKRLGVDRVRIFLTWNAVAPDPDARTEPSGFVATDPAAYPAVNWAPYDAIVRDVLAAHLSLDVVLGPPPPRWAAGPGAPQPAEHTEWKPSASDFEQFVQAAGTRYSGHYVPPGQTKPLPRVAFWSVWNEPNFGVELAPEAVHHSRLEVAPAYYRAFADAAWKGLAASGHEHDTTLIGELAPAGTTGAGHPGNFDVMAPLRFLRALYCVGATYQPLRGAAARARDCPATAAGSARFAAAHPALFKATAFADHPYPQGLPPNRATPDEPDYAELAAVPHLLRVLDTLQRRYGSHRRFGVYSTEFGYITNPPNPQYTVTPALAAEYLNWSEYITWREPRLLSYNQYLLNDPPPAGATYAGFATGLYTYSGAPKPGFYAYRMPIWLPAQETAKGHPLAVWGLARPAHYVHRPGPVRIQFAPRSGRAFRTMATVPAPRSAGYFYEHVTFPGSGSVRIAWSYPGGSTIFSRTVPVTVG